MTLDLRLGPLGFKCCWHEDSNRSAAEGIPRSAKGATRDNTLSVATPCGGWSLGGPACNWCTQPHVAGPCRWGIFECAGTPFRSAYSSPAAAPAGRGRKLGLWEGCA